MMSEFTSKQVADDDLVARYLADQLSPEDRARFEAQYAQDPALLRDLERTARFKAGLMDLQQSGRLDRLVAQDNRWRRLRPLALAASLVLFIAAAVVWLRQPAHPVLAGSIAELAHDAARPLAMGATYRIEHTRAADVDAVIEKAPRSVAKIELRADAPNSADFYRVTMAAIDNGERATLSAAQSLAPNADGVISVYVDTRSLRPGTYALTLEAETGTREATSASRTSGDYLIEIIERR